MTIDMIKNAKDLIAKGKQLSDPELIQMGMDLLSQYDDKTTSQVVEDAGGFRELNKVTPAKTLQLKQPQYVCENCGHTMPVDKEDRKRCPECKKHKLIIQHPERPSDPPVHPQDLLDMLETQQRDNRPPTDMDQFKMQVRDKSNARLHYDENGKPDGIIRRIEPIDPNSICNIWQDDGEDADDPQNELLKKFTKVSPRTRKPVNYVTVECEQCHKEEEVHPIHAGARGRYLCDRCIRKRSPH